MPQRRILVAFLSIVCLATPCLAHHMAVVTDKDNKIQNVTSAQLARIFKGETRKWPDGRAIVLVLHQSSNDEVSTLSRLTKMTATEFKAMMAEHKEAIRRVVTDADLIEAVSTTPGAVGLVEERSINDRVTVIKVDGKLPLEAGYLPH